jgi:hypothetical protein
MPHVSNNKWYCLTHRRSFRSFIYTSIHKGCPTPRHILFYYLLSSNHGKPRNYNAVECKTNLRETSVCLSDIYLTYLERFTEPWVLDPPRYAFKGIVLKGANRRLLFVSDSVGQEKCKSEQKYEPRGIACVLYSLLPVGRGVVRVCMPANGSVQIYRYICQLHLGWHPVAVHIYT